MPLWYGQSSSGGGGGGGAVSLATVALTANQIAHLHSAPVTLVAAPGAGKAIVPVMITMDSSAGTPYTNDTLPTVYLGPAASGNSIALFNGVVENASRYEQSVPTTANSAVSLFSNVALIYTDSADDGGTGNLTIQVNVLYYTVTL